MFSILTTSQYPTILIRTLGSMEPSVEDSAGHWQNTFLPLVKKRWLSSPSITTQNFRHSRMGIRRRPRHDYVDSNPEACWFSIVDLRDGTSTIQTLHCT